MTDRKRDDTDSVSTSIDKRRYFIAEWIRSDALRALVKQWGGELPMQYSDRELLEWLNAFAASHWDMRRGAERNLAQSVTMTEAQCASILEVADELRITEGVQPHFRQYDHMLILGGLMRSCLMRTAYAAELYNELQIDNVTVLGGYRPLAGDEIEMANKAGLMVYDEFNALCLGVERAFGLKSRPVLETSSRSDKPSFSDWTVADYGSGRLSVVAAPSSEPALRRANTADTFAWWSERHSPLAGKRLLLVTSAIYTAYQDAVAAEMLSLPHKAYVETVGVPRRISEHGDYRIVFRPEHYLQEIRSTIYGFSSLYGMLADGVGEDE